MSCEVDASHRTARVPVRSLSDQSNGLKTTLNWFFSRNSRSVVQEMRLDEREDGALDRAAGGEQLRRGIRVGGDELLSSATRRSS